MLCSFECVHCRRGQDEEYNSCYISTDGRRVRRYGRTVCCRGSELVRQETRERRQLRRRSDGVQVASDSDVEESLSSWSWPRR